MSTFVGNVHTFITYTSPSPKKIFKVNQTMISSSTVKIDHANGTPLGMSIEPASENELIYSHDFSQSAWVKTHANITANSGIAPDGTNTAFALVDDNNGGSRFPSLYENMTVSGDGWYTFSGYLKNTGNVQYMGIRTQSWDSGSSSDISIIDLDNQIVTDVDPEHNKIEVEGVGDGWVRFSVTRYIETDLQGIFRITMAGSDSAVGINPSDGTWEALCWGFQVEKLSFATSLIDTSGTTASRNSDIITISTSDIPYNSGVGTLIVDVNEIANNLTSDNQMIIQIKDNVSNTSQDILLNGNTNVLQSRVVNSGTVLETSNLATINTSSVGKIGISCDVSNFIFAYDGSIVSSSNTANVITNANVIHIGSNENDSEYMKGHIRSIKWIPRLISNTHLESETT